MKSISDYYILQSYKPEIKPIFDMRLDLWIRYI